MREKHKNASLPGKPIPDAKSTRKKPASEGSSPRDPTPILDASFDADKSTNGDLTQADHQSIAVSRPVDAHYRPSSIAEDTGVPPIHPDASGGIVGPGTGKSKPRPRDPIWDAFAAEFWPEGIPEITRKHVGLLVKTLKEQGATAEEIPIRKARYIIAWGQARLTPDALVKHWQRFSEDVPDPNQRPGRIPLTAAKLAELDEDDRLIRSQGRPE